MAFKECAESFRQQVEESVKKKMEQGRDDGVRKIKDEALAAIKRVKNVKKKAADEINSNRVALGTRIGDEIVEQVKKETKNMFNGIRAVLDGDLDEKKAALERYAATVIEERITSLYGPYQDRIKELEDKNKELEDKSNNLEDTSKGLENRINGLENRSKELENRSNNLEDTSKGLDSRTIGLEDKSEKLENRINELENRSEELEDKSKELEKGMGNLKEELDALKRGLKRDISNEVSRMIASEKEQQADAIIALMGGAEIRADVMGREVCKVVYTCMNVWKKRFMLEEIKKVVASNKALEQRCEQQEKQTEQALEMVHVRLSKIARAFSNVNVSMSPPPVFPTGYHAGYTQAA
eukprot:CAMPEP_0184664190 /NCGR_PEP_ID=MMETSP0308-20130426/51651_1 /TAXON_ID=38269 /ORGANISM="Gloeochaete witrockiana, Strain SAG 46.84" /LENGTH=353 /DNA_ID=CAMNT_0027107409 /DNA_START=237 /DNA_END=1298 /DNA_ORIENTATION=+